jgi:hypothetical protein
MYLRRSEPEEIFHVAENMRERDYDEISALRWTKDRKELAYAITNNVSDFETVLTCGDDEGPIAIVSYIPVRPGVWNLGMFATDRFKKIGIYLTKRIIRDIIPALDRSKAHRVEAWSVEGYTEVHNWLRFLGLKEECKVRKCGKNGEDFKIFSFVRDGDENVRWRSKGEVS